MTARTLKCILMVTLAMLFLGSIHLAVAAELHLFAGAGLRQPVDQLVKEYEASTGNKVYVDYGGSGQLLAKINAAGQGDLFMPGSLMYIEKLQQAGKVLSSREVVAHTPVIGVHRKSADRITTFEDLAKPGMRLAMGDPKAMALGRTLPSWKNPVARMRFSRMSLSTGPRSSNWPFTWPRARWMPPSSVARMPSRTLNKSPWWKFLRPSIKRKLWLWRCCDPPPRRNRPRP